jgi:hypothetical protein
MTRHGHETPHFEATDVLKARGLDSKTIRRLRQLASWSSRITFGLAIGAYLLPDQAFGGR